MKQAKRIKIPEPNRIKHRAAHATHRATLRIYIFKSEQTNEMLFTLSVPQQYDQRNEEQLWQAEKMICKEFRDMVGDVNPRKDIAGLVASYISKWNPYGLESEMKTYFEKINDPDY